jgi:uncharacterized protein YukE
MALLGDPTVLEGLAARYDRHADCVRTTARRLCHATESTTWECDAAERFRAEAGGTDARATGIANDMQSLAQQLRVLAARQRDELAQLASIEARVRELLIELQGRPNPPWTGTPWNPANLPAPCDTDWHAVGRAFGV